CRCVCYSGLHKNLCPSHSRSDGQWASDRGFRLGSSSRDLRRRGRLFPEILVRCIGLHNSPNWQLGGNDEKDGRERSSAIEAVLMDCPRAKNIAAMPCIDYFTNLVETIPTPN